MTLRMVALIGIPQLPYGEEFAIEMVEIVDSSQIELALFSDSVPVNADAISDEPPKREGNRRHDDGLANIGCERRYVHCFRPLPGIWRLSGRLCSGRPSCQPDKTLVL